MRHYLDQSTGYPLASETSEKWRSITTSQLYSQMMSRDTEASSGVPKEKDKMTRKVTSAICDSLFGDRDRTDRHLNRIIESAWEVAAMFAQQRCRLQLWTVHDDDKKSRNSINLLQQHQDDWPSVALEDVKNPTVGPEILFTASPALLKWGNGYGQDLEKSLFIVKSRVCSGNEETVNPVYLDSGQQEYPGYSGHQGYEGYSGYNRYGG